MRTIIFSYSYRVRLRPKKGDTLYADTLFEGSSSAVVSFQSLIQQTTGASSGNMLSFQASMSGSKKKVSAFAYASLTLALSLHTLWVHAT